MFPSGVGRIEQLRSMSQNIGRRGRRMHIIVRCPRCGYRWWLDADAADRRMRCRKCFTLLKVPHLAEVADAVGLVTHSRCEVYVDDAGRLFG